jgi:ubiquinone/menaquinone biosynthesis C-methylase UbiE
MADTNVIFDDAAGYERFMGRWSRAIGEKFLAWLDAPANARWLDVGCGTGAFSKLISERCTPSAVSGVDPAPAQVEHARQQLPKVDFRVAGALALPFKDNEFDVVASALVLHFLPDRGKAFDEMRRVVGPDGIVAGYTWNRAADFTFAPYAPMARGLKSIGAQVMLSPLIPEADTDGLQATLEAAGFRDIAITKIEAAERYRDFDDYWQVQTMAFHPIGKSVAALGEAERNRLRETMREMLPPASDGSIGYSARAIAFKSRRPA